MSQYDWDFGAPTPSGMGDHDVPLASDRLAGRRVALLVTGGIAAMKTPELARGLRRHGARVTAFASEDAASADEIAALAREVFVPAGLSAVVLGDPSKGARRQARKALEAFR